jgi:hypothetical protein
MSQSPQLSPAIRYIPRAFEDDSAFAIHGQEAAALSSPNVLLVGRNGSWGKSVLKSLDKVGSELSLVAPLGLTAEYVRKGGYDLVLLDSSVPPELRRQLAFELVSSDASIFYSFPVENGCWWLPALRRGEFCHGAPAFRRSEFPVELERILSARANA